MAPHSVLILFGVFLGFSTAQLACTKGQLVVKGRITGSAVMNTLLEHLASRYSDSRRQFGIEVRLELQKSPSLDDDSDGSLFRIPSKFSWAQNNELVFPVLSRYVV